MSIDLTTMVIMTQLYQPFHYLISSSLDCLPYNSFDVCSENLVLNQLIIHKLIFFFIIPILKSLVIPVIWLALIDVRYSRIAPFFALNDIFFSGNEEATLKTKRPIRSQGLFKVTDQIAEKWKTKSFNFFLQLLFPPKKWMNLISDLLSTASAKRLNWSSPVSGRF